METDQEESRPEQPRETESTDHDVQEWEKALAAITGQVDTLLDTAPDTRHGKTDDGYVDDDYTKGPIRVPLDILKARHTVNKVAVRRKLHTDGSRRYFAEYTETASKADTRARPDEPNYNSFGRDHKVIMWDVQPDETIYDNNREDYTPETLQTLAARVTELETTPPRLDLLDEDELPTPSRSQRLRAFGARILGRQ